MSVDFTTIYPADGGEPWEASCDHCGRRYDLDHYGDMDAHDTLERAIASGLASKYRARIFRWKEYRGGRWTFADWGWNVYDQREPGYFDSTGFAKTFEEALAAACAALPAEPNFRPHW